MRLAAGRSRERADSGPATEPRPQKGPGRERASCAAATEPRPRGSGWGVAGALALALLSYFGFPGHTWLQQDSQIYAAILEHQRDPATLAGDLVVKRPHVAYTLYDEATQMLSAASGQSFERVLEFQQIAARALGIWGVWLMAGPLGAAIFALGASVAGPAVFTMEFEPTPRAIALPLLLLAMGLASRRRYDWAGLAAAGAIFYHVPTAWPVLAIFLPLAIWRREWRAIGLVIAACVALLAAAHGQTGQSFSGTLSPLEQQLQRMRAAYVWVSLWPPAYLWHWTLVLAIALAAYSRVRRALTAEMRAFWLALPLLGAVSLPVSYLLLEGAHLAAVPQIQPMRALLFTLLAMQLLASLTASRALMQRRWTEGAAWMFAAFLPPLLPAFPSAITVPRALAAIGLAGLTLALWRISPRLAPAAALVGMFAIPGLAGVVFYPKLHTPELTSLSAWARQSTQKDAVFLFPDIGRGLEPGVFRAEALRSVYVDWKGGGQMNYLRDFAPEWWRRWQQTMLGFHPADLATYRTLGIRYIVLHHSAFDRPAVFRNGAWAAYDISQ